MPVTALYENVETTTVVVDDLLKHHFDRDQISVVTKHAQPEGVFQTGDRSSAVTTITQDTEIGAVVGGLSGLVVGLAALAIPGIGPLVAAGPIASALIGLGVGAATGGLIGALSNVGVSYEQLEYYAEGIRQGHTLVVVQAPEDRVAEAQEILNQYDPVQQPDQKQPDQGVPPVGERVSAVDMAK